MSRGTLTRSVEPGALVRPVNKMSLDTGFDLCVTLDSTFENEGELKVCVALGLRARLDARDGVKIKTCHFWQISEGARLA